MSECKNTQKPGANNSLQSAIVINDHGTPAASTGDNTISGITCDASVFVGALVRMNGTTVVNAQANNTTNSKVIGVCVAKSGSTTCDVQVTGYTDAVLSGLSPSENYFLSDSTPGQLTTTAPTASGAIVLHVGRAYTSTRLVIQIGAQIRRA